MCRSGARKWVGWTRDTSLSKERGASRSDLLNSSTPCFPCSQTDVVSDTARVVVCLTKDVWLVSKNLEESKGGAPLLKLETLCRAGYSIRVRFVVVCVLC